MLRGDPKYIKELDQRRNELDAILVTLPLTEGERAEATRLLDEYQNKFHAWAQASQEVDAEVKALSNVYAEMEPHFETMFEGADNGLESAKQALEAVRSSRPAS